MILTADSGSTKTDWALINGAHCIAQIQSAGCNPYFLQPAEMRELFYTIREQLPPGNVDEIYFYGAGCTPGEKTDTVARALASVFGHDCAISVESDMLGAARALCGTQPGIACILGTGSNSCLYDGQSIVANVSPLGFILGDEGSGANLGKIFVGSVLKDQISAQIKEEFLHHYGPVADIIERVYRKPLPNRWLASLSPFILSHIDCPQVKQMVEEAFGAFLRRNIANYNRPDLCVNLTGSVAYYYKDIICQAARDAGFKIGSVTKSPLDGLVAYHTQKP